MYIDHMHHIDYYLLRFLCSNSLSNAVCPCVCVCVFPPFLSTLLASWLGKLEQIRKPPPPLPLFLKVIGSGPRKTKKSMRSLISIGRFRLSVR